MSVRITERDTGLNLFMQQIARLEHSKIRVGIQDPQASMPHKGNISTINLAVIHEFGADVVNIPQRSFIRATADKNRNRYSNELKKITTKTVKRFASVNVKREFESLGDSVVQDMQKRMDAGIPPSLKDATIAEKIKVKSPTPTTPLVRFGDLRNSITRKVVLVQPQPFGQIVRALSGGVVR